MFVVSMWNYDKNEQIEFKAADLSNVTRKIDELAGAANWNGNDWDWVITDLETGDIAG